MAFELITDLSDVLACLLGSSGSSANVWLLLVIALGALLARSSVPIDL